MVEHANPGLFSGAEDQEIPPERLEAELDATGLEYAVILPQPCPGIGIDVPAEYVHDYCRRSRRLIPFASINPLTEREPIARLRRFAEQGARGLTPAQLDALFRDTATNLSRAN